MTRVMEPILIDTFEVFNDLSVGHKCASYGVVYIYKDGVFCGSCRMRVPSYISDLMLFASPRTKKIFTQNRYFRARCNDEP